MKKLKIGYLINFKKAKLPNKTRLLGKYTILEPLQIKRHSTVLFNTFLKDKSKNIWTYMPYGPFKNLKTFVAYLKKHCLKKALMGKLILIPSLKTLLRNICQHLISNVDIQIRIWNINAFLCWCNNH